MGTVITLRSKSWSEESFSNNAPLEHRSTNVSLGFRLHYQDIKMVADSKRERKSVERFADAPIPEIKKKASKPKASKALAAKKEEPKAKTKAKKDPNAPKRGLSAFMFFSTDKREDIKAANPGCSFGDVGKFLGEAWAKVDDKAKAKYQKQADNDKVRYEKEKAKYDKKK